MDELHRDLAATASVRGQVLLVRDFLKRTGASRDSVLAALLRAGTISSESAAALLQPVPPPSPPPSPPMEVEVTTTRAVPSCRELLYHQICTSPSAEIIKTYLDTIMLLTTLLLGPGAAFLLSFETEALDAADARWIAYCANATIAALPGVGGWCTDVRSGHYPSYVYGQRVRHAGSMVRHRCGLHPRCVRTQRPLDRGCSAQAIWAYGCLATALALAVFQYVLFLAFRLDAASTAVRDRWWCFFQWPCHAALLLFLVGAFLFVYTNSVVARLVFTVDIALLLDGSSGGLWQLVQTIGWLLFGFVAGVATIDGVLLVVWRQQQGACTAEGARPAAPRSTPPNVA